MSGGSEIAPASVIYDLRRRSPTLGISLAMPNSYGEAHALSIAG
jgi:hypothetical protein